MMTDQVPPTAPVYKDDDLVYVDPDLRTVVGLVEFTVTGKPKSLARPTVSFNKEPEIMKGASEEGDAATAKPVAGKPIRRAPMRVRYYPWGTYRSMRKIYKLEGKQPREESPYTLDDVIEKALTQPFWD